MTKMDSDLCVTVHFLLLIRCTVLLPNSYYRRRPQGWLTYRLNLFFGSIGFFSNVSLYGPNDVVNTSDNKENYPQLIKTSADWFIVRENIKVSLGVSYNTGSDPMQGLKTQSYWLFLLNFLK